MSNQEEFFWIVQTVVLDNNMMLSTEEDNRDENLHVFSATGNFIICDEAILASNRIPETMSAKTAANQFCTFMKENLHKIEEKANGKRLECPHWFMRFGTEPED